MLAELRVRDLGVIAELSLVLDDQMTALTGETGAGKTLVVEAVELLVGGRADASIVRAGAAEAVVEGRFVDDDGEVVVARTIPRQGRSRAYIDGRMATVAELSSVGQRFVDLHGQHAHQSLLHQAAQRQALDRFAGVDLAPVEAARAAVAEADRRLGALGGDPRERARAVELLRFEVSEIDGAQIAGPDEEDELGREATALGEVEAARTAAAAADAALSGGEGAELEASSALARLAEAATALQGFEATADLAGRLRAAWADVDDAASELRRRAERLEDDPERLEAVRARLRLLAELRRKYGASLAEVLEFGRDARDQLAALEGSEEARAAAEADRVAATEELEAAERVVGAQRRAAAPELAAAIESHLRELALERARLEVRIGDDPSGASVELLLSANPGEPPLPLAKVASGGELARAMLATRLVLTAAPPTLVFDEVDAGVGGEAALAVGRALAAIGRDHQVLVVTHLAQVAAFADQQIVVEKLQSDDETQASARPVAGEERVVELSRMLSGHPDSPAARSHAKELLGAAAKAAGRRQGSGNLGRRLDGRSA